MNIILCGPPLTGKTTLGKFAAKKLCWEFKDTDQLIEKYYSLEKDIRKDYKEIRRQDGEEVFRYYERRAITSLETSKKNVIALGGGSLNDKQNVSIIKKLGSLIYIKTSLEDLQKRLLSSPLPTYLEKEKDPWKAYKRLLKVRSPIYELYADKIIETDFLTLNEVVSLIIRPWESTQ